MFIKPNSHYRGLRHHGFGPLQGGALGAAFVLYCLDGAVCLWYTVVALDRLGNYQDVVVVLWFPAKTSCSVFFLVSVVAGIIFVWLPSFVV